VPPVLALECPACKTLFQVPEAKADGKAACPACGQRRQVPSPLPPPRPAPSAPKPTTAEHTIELGELVPPPVLPLTMREEPAATLADEPVDVGAAQPPPAPSPPGPAGKFGGKRLRPGAAALVAAAAALALVLAGIYFAARALIPRAGNGAAEPGVGVRQGH
jgi:hypothetical protein